MEIQEVITSYYRWCGIDDEVTVGGHVFEGLQTLRSFGHLDALTATAFNGGFVIFRRISSTFPRLGQVRFGDGLGEAEAVVALGGLPADGGAGQGEADLGVSRWRLRFQFQLSHEEVRLFGFREFRRFWRDDDFFGFGWFLLRSFGVFHFCDSRHYEVKSGVGLITDWR
jgi:hypothetical protein